MPVVIFKILCWLFIYGFRFKLKKIAASAVVPNWAGALSVFANTDAFSTEYSYQIPRGSPMVNVYFYIGGNTEGNSNSFQIL